jgi:phosphate acetyltransferase
VIELLLGHLGSGIAAGDCIGVTYDEVHVDPDGALSTIVALHRALAREHDALVVVGTDYTDVASPTELTFNARVAANLGAPVLVVVSGRDRSAQQVAQVIDIALAELSQLHAQPAGAVVNRCAADQLDAMVAAVGRHGLSGWALPEAPLLSAPCLEAVVGALDGELLSGAPSLLRREVEHLLVCGMGVEGVIGRLRDGQLCVAAGDRPEVLLALAAAHAAPGFPSLAGVVLNEGFRPPEVVAGLARRLAGHLPVVLTEHSTADTARIVASTRGTLGDTQRKVDTALGLFEDHVRPGELLERMAVPPTTVVTPLMFEAMLLERAREDRRHIVLPEGTEDRILRAAASLLSRQVVQLTLLGDESRIRGRAAGLGLDLDGAAVIDPWSSDLAEGFAREYARLRAHKGMTVEVARDVVLDVSYFGTLMVHLGHADGMVSGAVHSTAHTITPSFEIIKTLPGVEVASSVFFMCLPDRVLVYSDCAVVPDPTAEQLAGIACSAADTAARFGIEPRVAMLSYATGSSGRGAGVEKVRRATELVRARRPDLAVEGPLQYDAAVDASVAATKLPGSEVAGRATVFVFPDLNTGNNTYKAVQRTAGAVAIGPVLQGLNKPVNDLSRGATVRDILNTIAITAIQAQG